jgi:hypothetical protein
VDRGRGAAGRTALSWLAALEAAGPVRILATAPGAYPLVSALHILGLCLLVGPILLADLRLLGALGPALDPALPLLRRAAACGLALAAATGLLLFAVQATEYAANAAFWVKLGLVAAGVANALAFRRAARPPAWVAAVSLSLWLAALLAGRWIAFV